MSATRLREWLHASDPESASWLGDALAEARPDNPRTLAAFVAATRVLGRQPLGTHETVQGDSDPVFLGHLGRDQIGRIAILTHLASEFGDAHVEALLPLYRDGDSREKAAVISALPLLPSSGRFVDLALDAGRTNETDLFAALATRNPYPYRHYDEPAFNKLVMKAAFLEVPIEEIVGLQERANADLARMGMDYIDERQAARRPFPPSIWLAIAPHAPAGALARMGGYLEHAIAEERLGAARGLALVADRERARRLLSERRERERDADVARAIDDALTET